MHNSITRLREAKIDPQKWQRLKSILANAMEQSSLADRTSFIRQHCAGDTDLLREAESLLAEAHAIVEQPNDEFEDCAENATRTLWSDDPSCHGKRVGAYTITRQLGRGGMGTVYLAARADGAFEKQVAIKVLKRGTDTEEVLRRFSTERHILARLDHPNIARLLDAGTTDDGLQYFVMEYVEGLPITRYVREHRLKIEERLGLFLKVCAAVEKAHKGMVIHRDLKPSNILVDREGEPKLLDFGIAKLLSSGPQASDLTATSQQLLTPTCASPEQARGDGVTAASDIYALGALLFEILAGRAPHRFTTKYPSREELARVVCQDAPPAPSVATLDAETADGLRGELDAIVLRAMQKDPADRYASVAEFAADVRGHMKGEPAAPETKTIRHKNRIAANKARRLKWVAAIAFLVIAPATAILLKPDFANLLRRSPAASTHPAIFEAKSIAVLPFQNLSNAAENAFFASGVQDAILTDLAKIADLKVINRTSVQQFQSDAPRNLREISDQLQVAYVLEGSVQRADNRVRVTAKLTDARTNAQAWAESFDRELADVFAIQNEIAQKIAMQLRATLSPKEKAALHVSATRDMVAYDLYLRAKEGDRNVGRSAEQMQEEVALLDEAIARDPHFVQALCQLARTHLKSYIRHFDHSTARLDLAKVALAAAARIAPDAGEVHLGEAVLLYWGQRDYAAALAKLNQARVTLPNDANIPFFAGLIERRQGLWEQSIKHLNEAGSLDPFDATISYELANTYVSLRRYEEAERVLDRMLRGRANDFAFRVARAMVDVSAKADLGRLQEIVATVPTGSVDSTMLTTVRLNLAVLQRDYDGAEQILASSATPKFRSWDAAALRDWYRGFVARQRGDWAKSRAAFEQAREAAVRAVETSPDDGALALMMLAEVDLWLGNGEAARREGEEAMQLVRVAKDVVLQSSMVTRLSVIYIGLGELERALDLLEESARTPGGVDYGMLVLGEEWDPLREQPRFQEAVRSIAPTQRTP